MISSSTENEIINNISSSPETISKRDNSEKQKYKIHELINQSSQETSKTVNTNRIDEGHFQINLSSQRDIIDKEVLLTTSKYSFCIFIRMIPLISNFFPFIGHLYIVSSKGSTHDFDSSKFVEVKDYIQKPPVKFIQLKLSEKDKIEWDKAIHKIDKIFRKKEFTLCANNSYFYVASLLNEIKYKGRNNYNNKDIFFMSIKESKYTSYTSIFFNYILLFILIIIIIIIIIFNI